MHELPLVLNASICNPSARSQLSNLVHLQVLQDS